MSKIKVAVAGVGNCASAIVQGVSYYTTKGKGDGLTYWKVGKYTPEDIEFVAAFDVSSRKVGKDLSEAILQKPNNTLNICAVSKLGVEVKRGPLLDGIGKYLKDVVPVSSEKEVDVVEELEKAGADILVNYLPVGSTDASHLYAESALESRRGLHKCNSSFHSFER